MQAVNSEPQEELFDNGWQVISTANIDTLQARFGGFSSCFEHVQNAASHARPSRPLSQEENLSHLAEFPAIVMQSHTTLVLYRVDHLENLISAAKVWLVTR